MVTCRNPECVNGRTPGVVITGKGNARTQVLGAKMRWAWVNCTACSATDDQRKAGAIYKHQHRSPQEISARAQMATDRVEYKKEPAVVRGLAAIKANAGIGPSTTLAPPPDNSAALQALGVKIDKLLEQNSKLAEQNGKLVDQLGELMIENRALRMQIEAQRQVQVNVVSATP